jgi:hypothetical protein
VSEKNDGEIQMWERGEIENRNGRKEKREGVGGDARTVRWSNTCGEMRERERRERGEIWSEDGREIDERKMEEERKNREREEWGRVIKTLNMNEYILCLYEIVNRNQKAHIQGVSEIRVLILTGNRPRQKEQLFYLPFCRKTMFNSKKKLERFFTKISLRH